MQSLSASDGEGLSCEWGCIARKGRGGCREMPEVTLEVARRARPLQRGSARERRAPQREVCST